MSYADKSYMKTKKEINRNTNLVTYGYDFAFTIENHLEPVFALDNIENADTSDKTRWKLVLRSLDWDFKILFDLFFVQLCNTICLFLIFLVMSFSVVIRKDMKEWAYDVHGREVVRVCCHLVDCLFAEILLIKI